MELIEHIKNILPECMYLALYNDGSWAIYHMRSDGDYWLAGSNDINNFLRLTKEGVMLWLE